MKARYLFLAIASFGAIALRATQVDYARDILPILSDKCYHCHGPDEKSRKAKLRLDTKEGAFAKRKDGTSVIIPGKSGESEVVRRISTTNSDDKMPPPESNRTLTGEQVALLKRWIDEGAAWGLHWAFVPPVRPAVPVSHHAWRINNPIDSFVQARLAREGLEPAEEAGKETILRRVTLDLTGLPPTVEELDAFLADGSTNAYDKAVERLLASPRFGERMATEWLDLARYADTHGYQMDRFRSMWPYRDWVIKAFNENLPFSEFVRWQVAGDLLPGATKEQKLATAFNRLHNQNEEGGIVEEEYRVAYVVDRVNTFSTAFLGLTTECTRCHDHKYDPLTQKDFYSLFAFFQNIDEAGQTTYFTDAMPVPTVLLSTDAQDKELAGFERDIAAKEKQMAVLHATEPEAFQRWLEERSLTNVPTPIAHFTFDEITSNGVVNAVNPTNFAKPQENPQVGPGKVGRAALLNGDNGYTMPRVGHFTRADAFTLALWLRAAAHTPRQVVVHHSKAPVDAGSRGYELLIEDGRIAFGLHHMWPRNSLKVTSKPRVPTNEWVHVAVTYDGSSRASGVKLYINGALAEQEVVRDGLFKDITYAGGEPDLAIGFRFRDNGFKGGAVDEFQVFDRAITGVEAATLAGTAEGERAWNTPAGMLSADQRKGLLDFYMANVDRAARQCAHELRQLRRAQAQFVNSIPEAMAMEEMPTPKPTYVLKRGAYDSHGESVTADTPKVLPPLPAGAPRNRAGLADWLLQSNHPLFARVTVNRVWQIVFGRGIVATSDNFGSQGAQPADQELLDWLAREFMEPRQPGAHPWDMKRLLKLMVTSATYRQSSKASAALLARDPQNEWLARGPAVRLTAEMVRDQALATSGLLVEKIGGPSVKPYQPNGVWDIAMGHPHYDQSHGSDLYRRSLYTFWKRTVPPPAMITFDAADRSYCTARRQSTSTPLQALALLNDVQLVEAARKLGERMLKMSSDREAQIAWLMRTATGRFPTQEENAVIRRAFDEQEEMFAKDPGSAVKFLGVGEMKSDPALPAERVAAAAMVAQLALNSDGSVWKR